jgi:hypothetical protein
MITNRSKTWIADNLDMKNYARVKEKYKIDKTTTKVQGIN